jgi:hypothetical protein
MVGISIFSIWPPFVALPGRSNHLNISQKTLTRHSKDSAIAAPSFSLGVMTTTSSRNIIRDRDDSEKLTKSRLANLD